MCGFYCLALLDYMNLFSLSNYKKNGKIMYKYFKVKYVKSCVSFRKINEKQIIFYMK